MSFNLASPLCVACMYYFFVFCIYMSNVQTIDFANCVGNYQHVFGANTAFINIHSIERYYTNYFSADINNANAVFANWRNKEQQNGYQNIIAAFDSLFMNKDIDTTYFMAPDAHDSLLLLNDISLEHKVAYLIREHEPTRSVVIHPIIVILFAFNISPQFKTFIVSRLPCIMNIDDAPKLYMELAKQYDTLFHTHTEMVRKFQGIVYEQDKQIQQMKHDLTELHNRLQCMTVKHDNAIRQIKLIRYNAIRAKISRCWTSMFKRKWETYDEY